MFGWWDNQLRCSNILTGRLTKIFDWWAVFTLALEYIYQLATPTTASAVLRPGLPPATRAYAPPKGKCRA